MGSMAELVHLDCQRKCPFESGQLAIDSRVPGAFLLALHTLTRSEYFGDADAISRHLADFPFNREAFGSSLIPSPRRERACPELAEGVARSAR